MTRPRLVRPQRLSLSPCDRRRHPTPHRLEVHAAAHRSHSRRIGADSSVPSPEHHAATMPTVAVNRPAVELVTDHRSHGRTRGQVHVHRVPPWALWAPPRAQLALSVVLTWILMGCSLLVVTDKYTSWFIR